MNLGKIANWTTRLAEGLVSFLNKLACEFAGFVFIHFMTNDLATVKIYHQVQTEPSAARRAWQPLDAPGHRKFASESLCDVATRLRSGTF
jgi:hypothetical protein